LLAAGLTGCAGPGRFVCEARGGRPWHLYRTAHFDVFSDAEGFQVVALGGWLERVVTRLTAGLAGEGAEVPAERVRVIALDDPDAFRDLAPPGFGGYFIQVGAQAPTVVLPIRLSEQVPQIVAHELAHHVSRFFYPHQPLWFAEGMAASFELAAGGRPGAGWSGGAAPTALALDRIARQPQAGGQPPKLPLDPRTLLTATTYPEGVQTGQFHAACRLLYTWLRNERPAALDAFQRRLKGAEPPLSAWLSAFPDLAPGDDAAMAALTVTLEKYRDRGYPEPRPGDAPYDPRVEQVRQVPAPEVHGLLRTARWVVDAPTPMQDQRWRGDLVEQLAEDPLDPEALVSLARQEKRSPVPDLRRSTAARPTDWRAWYWLGMTLCAEGPPTPACRTESESATRRALALAPDEGGVLDSLARILVRDGRLAEALPLSRRAVQLAPINPSFLDTLAVTLANLGQCAEALATEERAVGLLPPSERPREPLARFGVRCGSPGLAPLGASTEPPLPR
jgi:tetratricopeptide (TPR) repeat protein